MALALALLSAGAGAFGVNQTTKAGESGTNDVRDSHGGIILHNVGQRCVYLVFPVDSMCEGVDTTLSVLEAAGVKGSFFLTGNFLREPQNAGRIRRMQKAGHTVAPHGDRHILLADWDRARTPLVSIDSLNADIDANIAEMRRNGLPDPTVMIPSFEWASDCHFAEMHRRGLMPFVPTPWLLTYRDYTVPGTPEYVDTDSILSQFFESGRTRGFDGNIIILHTGTWDERRDKLYHRLPQMIDTIKARGYSICPLP